MDEQFTFTKALDTGLMVPPNYTINFCKDGIVIGVLDFNGSAMVFTGEAEESAKVLFGYVAEQFKGRLEQERAAALAAGE